MTPPANPKPAGVADVLLAAAEMLALADRVERADPADWRALRALAKDIYRALNDLPTLVTGGYGWQEDDSGWWLQTGEDQRIPPKRIDPPKWLTSIDAAMSLVPEGWGWTIGDKAPDPSIAWCEIDHLPWHDGYGWAVERKLIVQAATPALALCSAALRARSRAIESGGA